MSCYNVILILMLLHASFQNYTYDVKYISIPVDHFGYCNDAKFNLRYLINDTYWNSDGPIFFYTGNEGDITIFAQNTGFLWELAAEFEALVVFAEHRYYGESQPFGNLSFSDPQHIGYLTSTQALADYVYLIDVLQEQNNKDDDTKNPVIAFGGSYGGMLAAWLRVKYPATVIGAIASSAPVWQFLNLVPCDIFNRITTSVYRVATSFDCSKIIYASWKILRTLTSTEEGKQWLSNNWKLCKPLESESDVEILLEWLQNIYGNLAMVNYPYPNDFLVNLPAYPVKTFCNKLRPGYSDPTKLVQQLGKALSVYINNTGTLECINIYSELTKIGELGWDFQSCTELVMPMCSKDTDMFITESWNFTKYSENCFDKWKVKIKSEKQAILEYGGKHLQTASNIVFSNGLLDPWSGGGVLKNISKTVVAYIIPDAAHHLDLRSYHQNDPPTVIAARNFHRHMIKHWLRNYYIDNLNTYHY